VGKIEETMRAEISRLARKELRAEVDSLTRTVNELKQEVRALRRRVDALEKSRGVTPSAPPVTVTESPDLQVTEDEAASSRLSPNLIKKLRKKLNITQAELATLVGVTPGAVAFWEQGRSRPRDGHKRALVSLRQLGRRDVAAMLAGSAPEHESPPRAARKKRVRMGGPRSKKRTKQS